MLTTPQFLVFVGVKLWWNFFFVFCFWSLGASRCELCLLRWDLPLFHIWKGRDESGAGFNVIQLKRKLSFLRACGACEVASEFRDHGPLIALAASLVLSALLRRGFKKTFFLTNFLYRNVTSFLDYKCDTYNLWKHGKGIKRQQLVQISAPEMIPKSIPAHFLLDSWACANVYRSGLTLFLYFYHHIAAYIS